MSLKTCSTWKPKKRINDPVHGAIFLSELEFLITSSPAFLRLGNVKQLGLGAFVYPGASYSRLSHSIGACHTLGLMLDAIERNTEEKIAPEDRIITRLAALMHDIGHYPYSHASEEVVTSISVSSGVLDGYSIDSQNSSKNQYFSDHEELGQFIIKEDPEISRILHNNGIDPDKVVSRLNSTEDSSLKLLVSSDLDCDRLDYLRRTSLHAGLPFGGIDAEYLIDNLTLDQDKLPCIQRKALGSADHFLMSRLYDFEQLPYHKAVVGFEEALKVTLQKMSENRHLDFRRENIEKLIKNGTWRRFDDQLFLNKIRDFYDEIDTDPNFEDVLPYTRSLLDRKAPKLAFELDFIENINDATTKKFSEDSKKLEEIASSVCKDMGIDERHVFWWKKTFPALKGKETGQRIRILNDTESNTSRSIEEEKSTLCSILDGQGRRHMRFYICLIDDNNAKKTRDEVKKRITQKLVT